MNNIKSILHDMEYLQCNELYLLGMDVIGKLNWLINFQEKTIFVSERPFVVDSNYTALPIKYKNNRPVTTVTIGIHSQRNCLLDFGFTGTIELPESPNINHYFSEKQQAGFTAIGLSSTMALSGLGKPDTVKYMKMDSVIFGGRQFGNVPVTIIEKTEPKIGVGFFSNYCTQLLLNHSNEAYYFIPTPNPSVSLDNFDARVTFRNGKLFITAKNLRANSSALSLSIEEEIKSVDGKRAVDFSDNCTFLNSFYLNNAAEVVIEKLTGEKLSIKRQQVK